MYKEFVEALWSQFIFLWMHRRFLTTMINMHECLKGFLVLWQHFRRSVPSQAEC